MNLKEKKKLGVIAASAGNHAQALAYHGADLGIPVTVVMPIIAPIMKVANCKSYGANVIVQGADLGEVRPWNFPIFFIHNKLILVVYYLF